MQLKYIRVLANTGKSPKQGFWNQEAAYACYEQW